MGAASTFELIIWKTTKHAFKWRLASESVTNENVCDMQSKTVFEAAMSSLLSSSRPFLMMIITRSFIYQCSVLLSGAL